jgi:hypothetical protein
MATLDISGALQAMVNSNTPAAMMERSMATAMFSDRVNDVVDDAAAKLESTILRVKKLEDEGEISPEQAQLLIELRTSQAENAKRFAARYFG